MFPLLSHVIHLHQLLLTALLRVQQGQFIKLLNIYEERQSEREGEKARERERGIEGERERERKGERGREGGEEGGNFLSLTHKVKIKNSA